MKSAYWWSVVAVAGLTSVSGANAASIAYRLDQTNVDSGSLVDGTSYGILTIDDDTGALRFTLSLEPSLTTIAGSNFGITEFGFNVVGANPLQDSAVNPAQWTLPAGWTANVAPPPNQLDGFGRFEAAVTGTGNSRQTTLVFYVNNTTLTLASFAESSTNNAGQGNVFFSAHVAGFNGPGGVSSGYFGGSTQIPIVPLPAAITLLLSGLAGIGIAGKRSRQTASNN
jgi:hypothetical protein